MSSPGGETVAQGLVQAAARLLGTGGRDAVSARRLAREVGTSTMAVYTHFGGMDELLLAVRREGFRRFGEVIDSPKPTEDPVADWMVQGWAYRHFALAEPHMWSVIFGSAGAELGAFSTLDAEAAIATFEMLSSRIERCVDVGRWQCEDVTVAAEVSWGQVHGLAGIELSNYFSDTGRDPGTTFASAMACMSRGFGDDGGAAEKSTARARSRARTLGVTGPR